MVCEAHLQRFPKDVIVSTDIENMFNACCRDKLIKELLRHPSLAKLGRYVAATYPPGTVALA